MLAAILVFWLLFNLFYNEKAVSFGPTILTTLGIFATFLGIALGLSEFDANNIQASVPALLGGLKTAFWASVAGVGGALLLKFRHQFFDRHAAVGTGEDGEVTGADFPRALGADCRAADAAAVDRLARLGAHEGITAALAAGCNATRIRGWERPGHTKASSMCDLYSITRSTSSMAKKSRIIN